MSKTLNRQVRLLNQNGGSTDPIATDGAPLSAHMLKDMPNNLNNMASYCEPCFQFLFQSGDNGPAGHPLTWWVRGNSSMPTFGTAFLAQCPILVPIGAKRLLWTLNTERGNFVSPEVPVSIDILSIDLWLSPTPLTRLDVSMEYPAASGEVLGTMGANAFTRFTHRSKSVSYTSGGAGGPIKEFTSDVTGGGWTDFLSDPAVISPVSSLLGAPVAYLTVAVGFSGAIVGDYIKAKEFSIWGQYE